MRLAIIIFTVTLTSLSQAATRKFSRISHERANTVASTAGPHSVYADLFFEADVTSPKSCDDLENEWLEASKLSWVASNTGADDIQYGGSLECYDLVSGTKHIKASVWVGSRTDAGDKILDGLYKNTTYQYYTVRSSLNKPTQQLAEVEICPKNLSCLEGLAGKPFADFDSQLDQFQQIMNVSDKAQRKQQLINMITKLLPDQDAAVTAMLAQPFDSIKLSLTPAFFDAPFDSYVDGTGEGSSVTCDGNCL